MATRAKRYTLSKFWQEAKATFQDDRIDNISVHVEIRDRWSGSRDTPEISYEVTIYLKDNEPLSNFSGHGKTPEAAIEETKRKFNEYIEPIFTLIEDRTEV